MFPQSLAACQPPRPAAALLLTAVLAGALACSEDRLPTEPRLDVGNLGSSAPLTATPSTLAFASPTAPTATITVTVQYTGLITSTLNGSCATVSPQSVPATKPPGSSVYLATFTVAPVAAGSCTVTMTDKKGRQVQVPVEVEAGVVDLRLETLVAGGFHNCGLTDDGSAYCWGWNAEGQLGDGTFAQRLVPTAVVGGLTFVSLTAGGGHTCGLTGGGAAYCWGNNYYGGLGTGSTTNLHTPTAVSGNLTFASLTAGAYHTCGLTSEGAAYCWGYNTDGEVGDGSTTHRSTPTAVSGGLTFATLAAGLNHTCGLTGERAAYCWGASNLGQLGDGTVSPTNRPVPGAVSGGLTFASLVADGSHTCGLTSQGTAYCWGWNYYGQVDGQLGGGGNGSTLEVPTPTAVNTSLIFASLTGGSHHTCGLTGDGTAYCWGFNGWGQIGDGNWTDGGIPPTAVSGGLTFATLAAGGQHTCGLTGEGTAYCWGRNEDGELGDGSITNRFTPTAVSGNLTFQIP